MPRNFHDLAGHGHGDPFVNRIYAEHRELIAMVNLMSVVLDLAKRAGDLPEDVGRVINEMLMKIDDWTYESGGIS